MTTLTLTDFLRDRIADDEAIARGAIEGYPQDRYALYDYTDLDTYCDRDYLEAMVRIGPTRVLAECEAKREIIKRCVSRIDVTTYGSPEREYVDGPADMQLLRLLALPYVNHPDFRSEWRA